jgi:hypothetical protein
MRPCCNDCYKVCEPLAGCPDSFTIGVPAGYESDDIIIEFVKPGNNVTISQLLPITEGGYIEVDLEAVPEGYFNPWGGSYEITFISEIDGRPITFVACDGNSYQTVCLTFAKKYSNQLTNDLILNIFNC